MARKRAGEKLKDTRSGGLGQALTPMIDVIFQLLLFFLVNIKFPTHEGLLKAFLPKAQEDPQPPKDRKDQAFTTLRASGQGVTLLVNDVEVGTLVTVGQRVMCTSGGAPAEGALDSLYKELQDYLRESNEKLTVIVKADRQLPYKYVIYVLNVCGRLKIENVMFAPPGSSGASGG